MPLTPFFWNYTSVTVGGSRQPNTRPADEAGSWEGSSGDEMSWNIEMSEATTLASESEETSTGHIVGNAALGLLMTSLSLLTIVGNALVMHAVRTDKKLQTVSNMFIVSLAAADLTVGLIVMPISTVYVLVEKWPFGLGVCQFWLSVDYTASTASIFNLLVLSIDRYWSVVEPLSYGIRRRTVRRAASLIIGAWTASTLWVVPIVGWHQLFGDGRRTVPDSECDTEYAGSTTLKVVTALVNYYAPLTVMAVLYGRIFAIVQQRRCAQLGRTISAAAAATRGGALDENAAERQRLMKSEKKTRVMYFRRNASMDFDVGPDMTSRLPSPEESSSTSSVTGNDQPSYELKNTAVVVTTPEKELFRYQANKKLKVTLLSKSRLSRSKLTSCRQVIQSQSLHQTKAIELPTTLKIKNHDQLETRKQPNNVDDFDTVSIECTESGFRDDYDISVFVDDALTNRIENSAASNAKNSEAVLSGSEHDRQLSISTAVTQPTANHLTNRKFIFAVGGVTGLPITSQRLPTVVVTDCDGDVNDETYNVVELQENSEREALAALSPTTAADIVSKQIDNDGSSEGFLAKELSKFEGGDNDSVNEKKSNESKHAGTNATICSCNSFAAISSVSCAKLDRVLRRPKSLKNHSHWEPAGRANGLRQQSSNTAQRQSVPGGGSQSLSTLSGDAKAARQLGVIMLAFCVCFLPYFACFIVVAFCRDCVDPRLMVGVTWIGYVNSTLNPFLYPLCNHQFRDCFRRMFDRLVARLHGGPTPLFSAWSSSSSHRPPRPPVFAEQFSHNNSATVRN